MYLYLESCIFVSRSSYEYQGKVYYSVSLISSQSGDVITLSCSENAYNDVSQHLLKKGNYMCALSVRMYGKRASFSISSIQPYK